MEGEGMKRLGVVLLVAASSVVLVACGSGKGVGTNSGSSKTEFTDRLPIITLVVNIKV